MVAHLPGTEPYELVIQLKNAHAYRNHVDASKGQLDREPQESSNLTWGRERRDSDGELEGFLDGLFRGNRYESWPSIPMKMGV